MRRTISRRANPSEGTADSQRNRNCIADGGNNGVIPKRVTGTIHWYHILRNGPSEGTEKNCHLTRFLTGQGCYTKYLHHLGLDESLDCTKCAATAEHITRMFHCPRFMKEHKKTDRPSQSKHNRNAQPYRKDIKFRSEWDRDGCRKDLIICWCINMSGRVEWV